jgi:guanine nucleotide-binding protein subunit alpha
MLRILDPNHSFQQYISLVAVEYDLGPKDALPLQYLQPFKDLYADAGVQQAIEKGNEFALHDNLK